MIGATACLLLGLLPGPAAAQTCYIVGYMQWEEPLWEGIEYAGPWAEVWYATSQPSPGRVYVPIACGPEKLQVDAWVIGAPLIGGCISGGQDGNSCIGRASAANGWWMVVRGDWYEQSGFYGVWDAKAVYAVSYDSVNYQNKFTHIVSYDFFGDDPDWGGGEGGSDNNDQPEPGDSPILVSLNTQRFRLTSVEEGVMFDLDADGAQERVAWTTAGEDLAFLAFDRNGNGMIDDGSELFGNHTVEGADDGFRALIVLSKNAGGHLDASNPFFVKLLLWTDSNHDGISQAEELRKFGDHFEAIRLGYTRHDRRDGHGNLFRYRGSVVAKSNKPLRARSAHEDMQVTRFIYDVFLQVQR